MQGIILLVPVPGLGCRGQEGIAQNDIAGFFCDHHDRGINIAIGDIGHDRGILSRKHPVSISEKAGNHALTKALFYQR